MIVKREKCLDQKDGSCGQRAWRVLQRDLYGASWPEADLVDQVRSCSQVNPGWPASINHWRRCRRQAHRGSRLRSHGLGHLVCFLGCLHCRLQSSTQGGIRHSRDQGRWRRLQERRQLQGRCSSIIRRFKPKGRNGLGFSIFRPSSLGRALRRRGRIHSRISLEVFFLLAFFTFIRLIFL